MVSHERKMSQPMLLLNTWYRYRCLITSEKMGRLVRCYEQNRKGSYTLLDIFPSNRNQVIRQKSLLIGCEVASNKNAARNVALPTKAIFPPCCCFFSGIGVCLSDITRALFCSLGTTCGWLTVSPLFAFVCCFQLAFSHVFVIK